MRTLSRSDMDDLLQPLPLFKNASLDPRLPHSALHPLINLALDSYRVCRLSDFELEAVDFEGGQVSLSFSASAELSAGLAHRLVVLDDELKAVGLRPAQVSILDY